MNFKKYFLVSFIIIFFIGFLFWQKQENKTNLNLTELKEFKDFPVATTSPNNVALYKKSFTDEDGRVRNLFLTLGVMKSDELIAREHLQKVHTNIFWDPNRCAQMQNVLGYEKIIFSDTFKKSEGEGFNTFIYKYDIQKNTLFGYRVEIPIQKVFTSGYDFFGISKNADTWILYKIDFEKNILEEKKTYKNNLDLITAGEELKWCGTENTNCVEENNFNFLKKDINFKENIDEENPPIANFYYKNKEVVEFVKGDDVGYYILGIQPTK